MASGDGNGHVTDDVTITVGTRDGGQSPLIPTF